MKTGKAIRIGDMGGSVRLSNEQLHAFAVALGNMVIPTGWHDWRDTIRIIEATDDQKMKALSAAISIQPNPKPSKRAK